MIDFGFGEVRVRWVAEVAVVHECQGDEHLHYEEVRASQPGRCVEIDREHLLVPQRIYCPSLESVQDLKILD